MCKEGWVQVWHNSKENADVLGVLGVVLGL